MQRRPSSNKGGFGPIAQVSQEECCESSPQATGISRTLKGWSRRNEHAAVLAEIERIVCERQIDTLIVASDIFDSMAPRAKARSMFYGAMDHIHERRPGLSSIVIAGNHDHAGQLEAPSVSPAAARHEGGGHPQAGRRSARSRRASRSTEIRPAARKPACWSCRSSGWG
jgi:DNA repair exonuclease SbcCD nuclease subunit